MYDKSKDRYLNIDAAPGMGIDCIMLTLNAGKHLEETLDIFYKETPIRWLYVIDGHSKDDTIKILMRYPRITIKVEKGMTTGKAFELLKRRVQTPWFIWIDVGKIPTKGWYDEMMQHTDKGDLLGSSRYRWPGGILDPTVRDPSKRPLGGPWLIRTKILDHYHVDDDYAQRNIDIIIKKVVEEAGGRYHLVTSTSHICYMPTEKISKTEGQRRHIQNAKGIVKYITPEYARKHAKYLLGDHWMLMMNNLPRKWIQETNPAWIPILKNWRAKHLVIAKTTRIIYNSLRRLHVV